MSTVEARATASQSTRLAHELVRQVQRHELRVGDQLPSERSLAETYEMSRPMVREALRMLAALDLIEIQVGRGTFVASTWDGPSPFSDLSANDLVDVVDAREVIEHGALRLAQDRATSADRRRVAKVMGELVRAVAAGEDTDDLDYRLHAEIVRCAHSASLSRMWVELEGRIRRTVRLSPHGLRMSPGLLHQHQLLADAILEARLDPAIEASTAMHEENRLFLRQPFARLDEGVG